MRRSTKVLAAGVVLALGLTACGGSDSKDEAKGAAAPSTTAGKAATGTPVKIGIVNNEGGSTTSIADARIGAEVAAKYANAELGGIGGHPIKVVVCKTAGTVDTSRACGNRMVDEGVSAVVLGTDSFTDQVVTPIVQAGIPYVNSAASGNAENTLPGAFNLSGGTPSNLAAIAQYAKDKGWTRASIIALNVAVATASVNGPGKQAFDAAGITFKAQFLPATQADLTSAVVEAMSTKPEMLVVAGGDVMCLAVARAVASLNADVQLVFASNSCLGKTLDEGAPPAVWTKTLVASGGSVGDDADSEAYTAALEKYGNDVAPGGPALRGYVGMLGLVRAANAAKVTDPSPATLLAAMKAAKEVPMPLGGGNTFTCDGTAIPSLPAICSAQELLLQPDGKGTYAVAARVDGASLMQ